MGRRYRTGPVAGTAILTLLVGLGVFGEAGVGLRGASIGSVLFGVVVLAVLGALAASGLSDLRGVRTEPRPDGAVVLRVPRCAIPSWRVVPAGEIADVGLVDVSARSRRYELDVTLRSGAHVRSGAISTQRPAGLTLHQTKAWTMVEHIRTDLGLPR